MSVSLSGPSLEAFRALRKKLIDTTLRNRMINYRPPSDRAAVGLEIRNEISQSIWNSLVVEPRKKFGFTGPDDPTSKEEVELPGRSPLSIVNDQSDLLLYTATPKSKREARLLGTYRSAQEQMEERGVNSLFLALGMLQWHEPQEMQVHRAPLILIPVALERTVRGDFKLSYHEGEISTNLSLSVKLDEYGITLPEIPQDLGGFDPQSYFNEVATAITNFHDWQVLENEVALNFFSFEKIALFLDLDPEKWPEDRSPLEDTDIQALLGNGYPAGESPYTDDTFVDDLRTASEAREVFEADSSQRIVIFEACRGSSMVVEGPPGTGKSQTIANLLAEMVSQGKKVLFVSEKMEALNVVFRNLERAKLAEAALNLHGQKANRRSFYDALKSTWFKQSRLTEATHQLERLTEIRNHLNRYVQDLHAPIEPAGISPRRLLVLASCLPKATDEDLDSGYDPGPLSGTRWDEMERVFDNVKILQEKVKQIGVPSAHPFWGSSLEFFGPDERQLTERALAQSIGYLCTLVEERDRLSRTLGVPSPETLDQISVLHRCVEVALSAPPLDGVALKLGTWRQNEARVRQSIDELRRYQKLRVEYENEVSPQAWHHDWRAAQMVVTRRADSFFGRLSSDYRQATNELRMHCRDARKLSPTKVKELCSALFEAQGLGESLHKFAPTAANMFGVQWRDLDSAPDQIETLMEWVLRVETNVETGSIPRSLLQFFNGEMHSDSLRESSTRLKQLELETREKLLACCTSLRFPTGGMFDRPISQVTSLVGGWQANLSRVPEMVGWNQIARDMRERNLDSVLHVASKWPLAPERLNDHVKRHWAHANIKRAFESRPSLAKFERLQHEQIITEFGHLDKLALEHNRARVAHSHLAGLPKAGNVGLTAELFRQCELKRGHKSIRWAFDHFSELILQIKPVCMMSPLSVATFLPRHLEMFDVVIFDEASQVKPEDSLSAISRARQAIVVGDSKQMPPTSFFDSLAQDDAGDDEEYDAAIGKMESILALYSAAVQNSYRRRDLRWHYRSLHQSLIQPSNRLFYSDKLVVFPSPIYAATEAHSHLGLRFNYDVNAVYDRGAARKINQLQADQVAKAAIDNIRNRPQESLMAVAFSKDQQRAIQDAFDRLCAREPGVMAEYDAKNPYERFQIKNLETVQGDQRDVVLISVGYGRDVKGALSMNFGPLNKESGARRLNVLMSRSKMRMEVFSSIRGGDIVVGDDRESGVRALKVFLDFAETGLIEDRSPIGQDEDSEFEIQVRDAIESCGYTVDPQVGTAGFRIDLAVRHPKMPGRYVLGIECDGATYHSARSARDRDRLRQMVLESRGWRLHRIWSTDWWKDREGSLKRAIQAIEQAIQLDSPVVSPNLQDTDTAVEDPAFEVWQAPPGLQEIVGEPYRAWSRPMYLAGKELHELPAGSMALGVRDVVAFEGPIHIELLIKRIRDSAGKGRAGARIRDSIQGGIAVAESQKLVRRNGEFLYSNQGAEIKARSRAGVPAAEKRIEYVPSEELDDAVLSIVRQCRSASVNDLAEGVKKLLGFERAPEGLLERLQDRVVILAREGRIMFDGIGVQHL